MKWLFIVFLATASARQGDKPFQNGFCTGSGVGGVVSSCSSQKTESACTSYTILWQKTCEWHAQPFAAADYQALSSDTKMQRLWSQITEDSESGTFPGRLSLLADALSMDMRATFNFASDQLPQGHDRKIIHSIGTHAKLQWVSTGRHPYTGLFKSGTTNGIIRFSLAAAPVTSEKYAPPGSQAGTWKVGFALKALRDGMPSANFVAMRPLGAGGQNSANFFENELVNHVEAPDNAVLKDKFAAASIWPNMVGLKDFAEYDSTGTKTATPVIPWMLTFKPTAGVKSRYPNAYNGKLWTSQLATLPAGTTVYDIFAQAGPKTPPNKIGELKILTAPVTSEFGDTKLFFQHRKMEFDFDQNKHWLKETSDKPVPSRFFGPLNLNAKLEPAVELDAKATCPFGAGTAYTELASSQKSHAEKDAYIAQLHSRIQEMTSEKKQRSAPVNSVLIGAGLVALLAVVVGAIVVRKFNMRSGETHTTIASEVSI